MILISAFRIPLLQRHRRATPLHSCSLQGCLHQQLQCCSSSACSRRVPRPRSQIRQPQGAAPCPWISVQPHLPLLALVSALWHEPMLNNLLQSCPFLCWSEHEILWCFTLDWHSPLLTLPQHTACYFSVVHCNILGNGWIALKEVQLGNLETGSINLHLSVSEYCICWIAWINWTNTNRANHTNLFVNHLTLCIPLTKK